LANQIHTLNEEVREDKVFSRYPYGGISGRGRGSDVFFIGKAPSYHAAKKGIAFNDEVGQFVLQHMKRKGFDVGQIYVTYMIKTQANKNRRPTRKVLDLSLEYLERELELVKPKLIVALGTDVYRTFGIKGSINQTKGRIFDTEYGKLLVLNDPAMFNVPGKGTEVPQFVTGMDAIKTYLDGWQEPPEHGIFTPAKWRDYHYGIDVEVEDYEDEKTAYLYSVGEASYLARSATRIMAWKGSISGIPVMHNAKYDIKWLEAEGMQVDKFEDTLLEAALLGHKPLALKDLMAIHLGGAPDKFAKVVGTGKNRKQYADIPDFLDYNSKDAWGTLALHNVYHPQIVKQGLEPIYEKEKKVLRVLLDMEKAGMPLDTDQVKAWRLDQLKRMGRAEKRLKEQDVDLSDLDAMRQKFWKGKPRVVLTAKSKLPSLSKLDLEENRREGDEWVDDLIEWKESQKFISTYLDNWLGKESLHPTFNQCGTQTWRFSCSNPNLQNVTKRGGSRLPYMFAAPEGYTFISADASQGELREMGNQAYHYTQDRAIADSYAAGIDMHSMSETIPAVIRVAELKGQPVRTVAKSFNFKLLYGGTGPGMANEYGIPKEEGQALIDGFYQKFPAIREVHNEYRHQALTTGYVKTLVGRPLYVPQMVMGEGQFHDRAERQAKNFPVQGGLMEVIKDAMLKFPQYLRMQVHDELLWLVPDNEVADFVVELEENLNSDPYDCIPYVWDIHTGKNWGEAKG
jgi:uracil-DNA glycosylase family 4